MKNIPVDRLHEKTTLGVQIKAFSSSYDRTAGNSITDIHRDDHYVFFLLKAGHGKLEVDFREIDMGPNQLFYILPSQIHTKIAADKPEGWFLAIDPAIIPTTLRELFEYRLNLQTPCLVQAHLLKQLDDLLLILQGEVLRSQQDEFHIAILHPLIQSFLGMAARACKLPELTGNQGLRTAELARKFKIALSENNLVLRRPSDYAKELNVTAGYLNDVVKETTGSSVSYWIHQEISIRSKRVLYYTDMDIKEIAYLLGFNDHAYFIRLFRKLNGVTPQKFRSLRRSN